MHYRFHSNNFQSQCNIKLNDIFEDVRCLLIRFVSHVFSEGNFENFCCVRNARVGKIGIKLE